MDGTIIAALATIIAAVIGAVGAVYAARAGKSGPPARADENKPAKRATRAAAPAAVRPAGSRAESALELPAEPIPTGTFRIIDREGESYSATKIEILYPGGMSAPQFTERGFHATKGAMELFIEWSTVTRVQFDPPVRAKEPPLYRYNITVTFANGKKDTFGLKRDFDMFGNGPGRIFAYTEYGKVQITFEKIVAIEHRG